MARLFTSLPRQLHPGVRAAKVLGFNQPMIASWHTPRAKAQPARLAVPASQGCSPRGSCVPRRRRARLRRHNRELGQIPYLTCVGNDTLLLAAPKPCSGSAARRFPTQRRGRPIADAAIGSRRRCRPSGTLPLWFGGVDPSPSPASERTLAQMHVLGLLLPAQSGLLPPAVPGRSRQPISLCPGSGPVGTCPFPAWNTGTRWRAPARDPREREAGGWEGAAFPCSSEGDGLLSQGNATLIIIIN